MNARKATVLLSLVFFNALGDVRAMPGDAQMHWLTGRVNEATGLVDAFDDGQDEAPLYANALAAIAFARAGELDKARGIFDMCRTVYENSPHEGARHPSGLLLDQRSPIEPFTAHGDFRTGENAWLVIAINFYETMTVDRSYAAFATNLLEAICRYRDDDINSVSYGAFQWNASNAVYATEFQVDIYAALRVRAMLGGNTKYRDFAADVRAYLLAPSTFPLEVGKTRVWLPFADPVFNGNLYAGDTPIFLDTQAWTVLAFYPPKPGEVDFSTVLQSIDVGGAWQELGETVTCDNQPLTGFADAFLPGGVDADWVWLEGTEFMSLALLTTGDDQRSQFYHQQIAQMLKPDGSLYHSCSSDHSLPNDRFPENYRFPSAASTCWYYFYETRTNPFQPTRPTIRRAVEISWPSLPSLSYQVQWSTELDPQDWQHLGEPVMGTGAELTVFDRILNRTRRYYRVVPIP